METAVAYIRVSSQRQVDEGGSLDSQTKQVEQFAGARDYQLATIFREEGESAKTDQRPQLQAMLRFCRERSNGVRVVIVPKIDRLARNVNDYTNLKVQLSRLGIRLESLGERIEDTPVGRFTETILASVAQFDNEIRAERCKGGMLEAVAQGRWVWKAPVGYRNVRINGKGTIEPDPRFGPTVAQAFRLLADGHQSARAVHMFLEQSGVRCGRTGFYKLIKNEVYMGRIHAFGRVTLASAPFVPLVDEITFAQANRSLRQVSMPQVYQVESDDFPLRGSMLCRCTRRYTASWSKGEQGAQYAYYRCPHCQGRSYRRNIVEAHFRQELRLYEGVEAGWQRLADELKSFDDTVRAESETQRQSGVQRVEELQALMDAIVLKNARGVISDELAKRQIDRLTCDIATVAESIPRRSELSSIEELIAFARRVFSNLAEEWEHFSLRTKKDLLRFMFPQGILYDPERGFRTPENSLSERFQKVVQGELSILVEPSFLFWKSLHEWLGELYLVFRK